jgi:hypothetical protein
MTKYKLVEGAGAFRARRSAGECRHTPRKEGKRCLQSGGPALSISTNCRAGYHRCSCAAWRINSRTERAELTPASLVAPRGPTIHLAARDLPGPSLEHPGPWRNCALEVCTGRKAEPGELPLLRSSAAQMPHLDGSD